MAERRMFAKSILESDSFMDMPTDAQMLYVRLNLAADDDGFCDNPRSIMRACGAGNDTMKILIAKKFVLTFEKDDRFIVVIKHWRMNNYIRKDTYRETKYKEFMRELYYDENNAYSMNPGEGHRPCISSGKTGNKSLPSRTCNEYVTDPSRDCDEPVTDPSRTRDDPLTQDRIGKDSIGKDSIGEDRKEIEGSGEEGKTATAKSSLGIVEKLEKERLAAIDRGDIHAACDIMVKIHRLTNNTTY